MTINQLQLYLTEVIPTFIFFVLIFRDEVVIELSGINNEPQNYGFPMFYRLAAKSQDLNI